MTFSEEVGGEEDHFFGFGVCFNGRLAAFAAAASEFAALAAEGGECLPENVAQAESDDRKCEKMLGPVVHLPSLRCGSTKQVSWALFLHLIFLILGVEEVFADLEDG